MAMGVVMQDQVAPLGIKSIDDEVSELVAMVREAQDRINEVESEVRPLMDAARQRLKMLLEYRGENWSDEDGYARVVADGTRTSYDTRALDKLILENPDQYGWLRNYRQERRVRGGVTIK
jgi:hypothetical protein